MAVLQDTLLFLFIFVLFIIFGHITEWVSKKGFSFYSTYALTGLIFTLIIALVYFTYKSNNCKDFFEIDKNMLYDTPTYKKMSNLDPTTDPTTDPITDPITDPNTDPTPEPTPEQCTGENGIHFELSPSKKCCNTYLAWPDECDQFYNTEDGKARLNEVCCGGGFRGRPVHYSYTPESDGSWQNKRNTVTFDDNIQVL